MNKFFMVSSVYLKKGRRRVIPIADESVEKGYLKVLIPYNDEELRIAKKTGHHAGKRVNSLLPRKRAHEQIVRTNNLVTENELFGSK